MSKKRNAGGGGVSSIILANVAQCKGKQRERKDIWSKKAMV